MFDGKGFKIFVQFLSGKKITVEVEDWQTVLALKGQIDQMENIPFEQQRFSYGDKKLNDNQILFGLDSFFPANFPLTASLYNKLYNIRVVYNH